MPFIKGYKMEEEHKRKIGQANKGRKPSKKCIERSVQARMGKPAWNKGKKTGIEPWNKGTRGVCKAWNKGRKCPSLSKKRVPMSDETKEKISAKRKLRVGELAPRWRGGINRTNDELRHLKEVKDWKKRVLERDNFICQCCGQSGGKLVVHHINNFSEFEELRTVVDNGIVLCEDCHNLFHKKYGYYGNTYEQIEEYLNLAGGYE